MPASHVAISSRTPLQKPNNWNPLLSIRATSGYALAHPADEAHARSRCTIVSISRFRSAPTRPAPFFMTFRPSYPTGAHISTYHRPSYRDVSVQWNHRVRKSFSYANVNGAHQSRCGRNRSRGAQPTLSTSCRRTDDISNDSLIRARRSFRVRLLLTLVETNWA